MFYLSHISFSQKRKYDGMGAVKEIIMPAQARTLGHFSLFYEATIPDDSSGLQPFWYKITFDKDCEFKFNLFPVVESDRYDFSLFKVEGNQHFCDAVEQGKIIAYNDIKINRTWNDSEQTQAFRNNLIFTKNISVKKGDVIYLELIHLWGEGLGHIIDFATCDYSYVLKAVKSDFAIAKKDSATYSHINNDDKNEKALSRIKESLCPLNGKPVQLSSIMFNEKTVNIGELKSIASETSNKIPVKQTTQPKDTLKLKCIISDAYTGEFIKTPPVIIEAETGQRIYPEQLANSVNEFKLQKEKKYTLHCYSDYHIGYNLSFSTTNSSDLSVSNNILEIQLEPITQIKNKLLQTIYFYPNSAAMKPESAYELKKVTDYLKNNPQAVIEIAGHCNGNRPIKPEKIIIKKDNPDWIFEGTSKELSQARANKIKQQLILTGIKDDRIKIISYGGDKPIYDSTKRWDELKKNMRVEVSLVEN